MTILQRGSTWFIGRPGQKPRTRRQSALEFGFLVRRNRIPADGYDRDNPFAGERLCGPTVKAQIAGKDSAQGHQTERRVLGNIC